MQIQSRLPLIGSALLLALGLTSPAKADISGTIGASMTLQDGCLINTVDTNNGTSVTNFGTLDFGSHNTLFAAATAQVNSTNGIRIQCSQGMTPILTFGAGLYDAQTGGTGTRAMRHSSNNTKYISYDLLRADATTVISSGHTISLATDGTLQTIVINGRAHPRDNLISGLYADTVTVTLVL